jgi:hypothetical protein
MAIAPKSIGPVVVPNAAGILYTSPVLVKTVLTRASINNVTAGAAALTLWLVRTGGARANSNLIRGASAAGLSVSAGPVSPIILNELAGLVLEPGDAIHGLSDTLNALNFTASGWTQ